MGDVEGQSGIVPFVVFLDENHCRNPHLLAVLAKANVPCEKHLDHFPAGLPDTEWLPIIAKHEWCLLTTDVRIRYNELERQAVEDNRLRMFYFSKNNLGGEDMGKALSIALPRMRSIAITQAAPFMAAVTRKGEVSVRVQFDKG